MVQPTPTNMRKVYYATQPIEAGRENQPGFLREEADAERHAAGRLRRGSDIVGFYAIRPIEKGDPLTPHNIDKTLPYLSERIRRACARSRCRSSMPK